MLVVSTPPGCDPERRYALDVVLGEFLGLPYRHEVEARDDVRFALEGRELVCRDAFGATPGEPLARWRASADLPEARLVAPDLPVLFGRAPYWRPGRLGVDVFATAYFLLARVEETVAAERDAHGRFPFSASLAAREGFVRRPVVDEHVEVLWAALARTWPGLERKRRAFRLRLTHDVDFPLSPHQSAAAGLLSAAADVAVRREPALAVRRVRRLAGGGPERDPFNTFDLLMDLSEARGLESAFYVIADGTYPLGGWVGGLLGRIHERGHELGWHGGYESFRDPARTRRELEALRSASPGEIRGGRQHYLRWENPTTWRNWAAVGLAYDSTLGFPEAPGFRSGTCHEHPVFDVVARRPLPLRERPLVAMEASAFDYLGLGEEETLTSFSELKELCRRFDGDFVLLWHNDRLVTQRDRRLYEAVLDA
jgi:hypothetical protein